MTWTNFECPQASMYLTYYIISYYIILYYLYHKSFISNNNTWWIHNWCKQSGYQISTYITLNIYNKYLLFLFVFKISHRCAVNFIYFHNKSLKMHYTLLYVHSTYSIWIDGLNRILWTKQHISFITKVCRSRSRWTNLCYMSI